MCVTDRHDIALAVKVALYPNTTNQPCKRDSLSFYEHCSTCYVRLTKNWALNISSHILWFPKNNFLFNPLPHNPDFKWSLTLSQSKPLFLPVYCLSFENTVGKGEIAHDEQSSTAQTWVATTQGKKLLKLIMEKRELLNSISPFPPLCFLLSIYIIP